ncbi:transmembrane epididymal protein 1-like [Scyliorhinus canicula]|uniref:transmembrane epididymal protein 1-like n=1 Tax=Scyliorhinus canicula TaxID=7830 RepID=UPI0018F48C58|nr:transmembrane epididymal protein 1-like [Scyliorhinus canicula]
MGTFIGHISPGLAFLSFGILYAFKFSLMVLRGQKMQLVSPARPPGLRGCLKRIPPEGVMKIVYGTLAVAAEFFYPPGVYKLTLYNRERADYPFIHPNEWQHATMYSYFALSGWVDIISQACLPRRVVLVESIAIALAFYTEALLLYSHMHGKERVENSVHSLLLLACFLVCLILTAEIWRPNDPVLWFAKTCLVMTQGTWLLHAAFILYRPFTGRPWKADDMTNLMFVTSFFCWHVALNMALLLAIFSLTGLWHSRCCGREAGPAFQGAKPAFSLLLERVHGGGLPSQYAKLQAAEEETQLLQECDF